MRRSVVLPLLMLLCLAPAVAAQDDLRDVATVWNDFTASLRRGDYRRAHALFSPQSRAVLPYGDFVAEYGPLSAAREMVQAKPDAQSTSLDGDWAELQYGGVNPAGGKFRVAVAFVRNGGTWGLVAARNEARERIEAGARALLAMLWQNRSLGQPRELLLALETGQAGNPVLSRYRMEWNGGRFQAFPRESGLRTFFVDADGRVLSVELPGEAETTVAAPAPEAKPATPPPTPAADKGMPELSEPPMAGFSTDLTEELPEPPPPPSRSRSPEPRGRPTIALPDTIE